MSLLARAQNDSNPNRGPQELQFKTGEILRVLHQNPNNLRGWWLCQLNGQTGLAPSDRLHVIGREKIDVLDNDHVYDIPILVPAPNSSINFSSPKNNGFQSGDKNLDTRRSFYENLNEESTANNSIQHQNFSVFNPQSNLSKNMLKQKSANFNFSEFDTGYDNVDPRTGLERRQRNNTSPSRKLSVRFKDTSPANKPINKSINQNVAPVPELWSQPPPGGNYGDYFNMRESEYINSHANLLVKRNSSNSDSNSINSKSASSSKSSSSSTSKSSDVPVVHISKYAANHYSPESQIVPKTTVISDSSPKRNSLESDEPQPILRNSNLDKRGVNGSDIRQSNSSSSSIDSKEVPIAESAILTIPREVASHTLDSLYGNFTQIISKLFRFIHSKWKTEECLRSTNESIKNTCFALQGNLKEFGQFCQGVLANAQGFTDHVMEKSLWKHMAPLQEKCDALNDEIDLCNSLDWSPEEISNFSKDPETDYLCHIINLVRSISIDVRSVHTNIKANLSLLFPIIPPKMHAPQSSFDHSNQFPQDSNHRSRYDKLLNSPGRSKSPYSASPDRGSVSPHRSTSEWRSQSPSTFNIAQRHNSPMRNQNLVEFRPESPRLANFKDMSPSPLRFTPTRQFLTEDPPRPDSSCSGNLTPTPNRASDKKNLSFNYDHDLNALKLYSAQMESHGDLLGSTMEELLKCLAQNHPPTVFVAHSKFLIKSATQIVHLANSLCQGLSDSHKTERSSIEQLANELCESLKLVIKETKDAAAEYPSLGPIQNLVCAVGKVRENAFHLRRTVRKAASTVLM